MDYLDWKKNTLEGGSFNATTAEDSSSQARQSVTVSTPTSERRTLSNVHDTTFAACHISANDRQKSRSLGSTMDVKSLETSSDNKFCYCISEQAINCHCLIHSCFER